MQLTPGNRRAARPCWVACQAEGPPPAVAARSIWGGKPQPQRPPAPAHEAEVMLRLLCGLLEMYADLRQTELLLR